ncbi:MAG: DUF6072 family protein [Acidimicrobiales bacterium]
MATATTTTANDPIRTVFYAVGETLIPGGSNFLKGDLKDGAAFAAAGWLAKRWFGVPGLVLVAASSLAKATTGINPVEVLLHSVSAASREKA